MPRKRKPQRKPQAPKKHQAKSKPKSAAQKKKPHNGFGSVWGNHVWDVKKKKWVKGVGYAPDGSVQKAGHKAPAKAPNVPSKAPGGVADGGAPETPLEVPHALADWRRAHPVTPPTFTGEWAGDLGGGPMQKAPGGAPKQNGAPLYSPAPPPETPTTSTAPEQRVSWGDLLAGYFQNGPQTQLAGWVQPQGTTAPPPPPVLPVRPDIDPATAQAMLRKISSGYVSGV